VRPSNPCNHGHAGMALGTRRCRPVGAGGRGPAQDPPAQEGCCPLNPRVPPGSGRWLARRPLAVPSVLARRRRKNLFQRGGAPPCNPWAASPRAGLAITPNQSADSGTETWGSVMWNPGWVNNPNLKAVASQMEQAKSNLRGPDLGLGTPTSTSAPATSFQPSATTTASKSSSDAASPTRSHPRDFAGLSAPR